jgi:hypothetical protein
MHVHVASPDGLAKFWLEPLVALADYTHMSPKELTELEKIVREHENEFKFSWRRQFSQ